MKRIFRQIIVLSALVLAIGCSGGLDFKECSGDGDCTGELVCSAEGYCVTQSSLYQGPALTSPACPAVYGPFGEENTILIGTILPTSGSSSGIGHPMEQAVMMAIDHFNQTGLGPDSHKLAAVLCDSGGDVERGRDAAEHLLSLGIFGVVGPAFSDVTIEVGSVYAKPSESAPGGLVIVSPSSTNPAITYLDTVGNDRIWRVAPSDTQQARAMGAVLTNPSAWGLPDQSEEPVNVVVVHKEGAYGTGLKNALQTNLIERTGQGASTVISYPDPVEWLSDVKNQNPCGDASCVDCNTGCCKQCWFEDAYNLIESVDPDVIVLIGTEEATGIMSWISTLWLAKDKKPVEWLVSEGGRIPSLFDEMKEWSKEFLGVCSCTLDGETDCCNAKVCSEDCETGIVDALGRIRGTAPANPVGPNFGLFQSDITSLYGYASAPVYSAHAYDATYLIGYGLSAALFGSKKSPSELVADDLVAGMRSLQSGTSIDATQNLITKGMQQLATQGTLDLVGASGPLDLDANGEPEFGAISVWTPNPLSEDFSLAPILDETGDLVSPVEPSDDLLVDGGDEAEESDEAP